MILHDITILQLWMCYFLVIFYVISTMVNHKLYHHVGRIVPFSRHFLQSQLHLYQGQDGRDGRDGRRHEEARRDERDRWYQAARQMARPVGETKKLPSGKKNITFNL